MSDKRIAYVPTMGNLHIGHLNLVEQAKQQASHVVVSIFVNPLQFGGNSDYEQYPRTLSQDTRQLEQLDVDVLFIPNSNEIYPKGLEVTTKIHVPHLSDILCGEFRSGHFTGVATVVNKFLNIVNPHILYLGEKDYQQLLVVRQMIFDLAIDVEVKGVATVREYDGLALSSRNQYLNDEQRKQAAQLFKILIDVKNRVLEAKCEFTSIEQDAMNDLENSGFKAEYVRICDANDLLPATANTARKIVLAAAWLGRARLIDNLMIEATLEHK